MDWKASTDADDAWGWHAHRAGKPRLCSGTYLPVNGAVTEFNNNMIDQACITGEAFHELWRACSLCELSHAPCHPAIELYSLSSLGREHSSPLHDSNMHPNNTYVLEYDHVTLLCELH